MASESVTSEVKAAVERRGEAISFAEYMQIALYHPELGYYRREKERVGFGGSTDFFTATSTGEVFGELVAAAVSQSLAPQKPEEFSFVEIGAEPGGGLFPGQHPFGDKLTLGLNNSLTIPERAVVFSNELFDAQPFHRVIFRGGQWREIGVNWEDGLKETELPRLSPAVEAMADRLPEQAPEGYHLDLPVATVSLLEKILSASAWRGMIVIFDYGKTWRELVEATPQGTARAYRAHRQSNDLLASPGEQDLTCHICWDWLEEVLARAGFTDISLQSQEAFFITRATTAIEAIATARPGEFDPRRQMLQQLLHPGNMGQKFQVLSARRG